MKILWISPWFGNYRIPVYENLNKLSGGNFYIICSQENTSDLVREKLKATLGDHAVIMSGEKRTTMGSEESDFANSALVIKRQPGLYKAVKDIKPDVVITEGFGGVSLSANKGITLENCTLIPEYFSSPKQSFMRLHK